MFFEYASLLNKQPLPLEEKQKTYSFVTERHLQALWFEQKYFLPLYTKDGHPIQVISPGIWNIGAGPDFVKAHLLINGKHVHGDIELHLRESGWNHHGHSTDEKYNDVVLHIALWPNHQTLFTTQRPIPHQAHLSLAISEAQLIQLIDLDLYPYKKFIGSGRCAQQLFCHASESSIEDLFMGAAVWRLKKKHEYLLIHTPPGKSLFQTGIAQALGFKKNADTFLKTYQWLASQQGDLFCLGMACLGFFDQTHAQRWSHIPEYLAYYNHQPLHTPKFKLDLHQIRPVSHPIRRLAALTAMLRDPQITDEFIVSTWKHNWQRLDLKKLFTCLKDLIPNYQDSYWNNRYTFSAQSPNLLPLIGDDLKHEIVINAILPLLHFHIQNPAEMQTFLNLYASRPSSNTGKIKYLTHRFFGDSDKARLLQRSITQQGAYQIHKDFCIHYEASCQGCPFVGLVQQQFERAEESCFTHH